MELTNAVVINKADGEHKENAVAAAAAIQQTLRIFASASSAPPEVMTCSALTGEGIKEIAQLLEHFRTASQAHGQWQKKRVYNTTQSLFKELNYRLIKDFYDSSTIQKKLKIIENEVAEGKITPHAAALALLKNFKLKK